MYNVETEKYLVRQIEDRDFEDVKTLLMKNEYLGMLWSVSVLPEDTLDELVRNIYMKPDTYYVIDKMKDEFCGCLSVMEYDEEGELSVRMKDEMDVREIMPVFGEILRMITPAGKKNVTVNYNFE